MRILIIDGEAHQLAAARDALTRDGHNIATVASGGHAEKTLASHTFDLVIADIHCSAVEHLRELFPSVALMVTGTDVRTADVIEAVRKGAVDFLAKPFDLDELALRVAVLDPARSSPPPVPLERSTAVELVGRSRAMLQVHSHLERFAATDAPVLITGESGTGKEVAARAIHARSSRASKPFVPVNCAAFPETLLEAELFGHERGAFTGAVRRRHGRFKSADGGTLFLDEVGEIPLSAQAKLLRVLEQGTFEPLGTNESVQVNVRLVSATHRNLKGLVDAGKFREDLVYRLKILELELPPLRERRGDIRLLADHFLEAHATPDSARQLTQRAKAAMEAYSFPGNVRELEHAIRHAIALSMGEEEIDLAHLPSDIGRGPLATLRPQEGAAGDPPGIDLRPLHEAVRGFENDYLRRALALTGGRKTRAAEMLGISRKSLWEKLRRQGFDDPLEAADDDEGGDGDGDHTPLPEPPAPRRTRNV